MNDISPELIEKFKNILSENHVVTDMEIIAPHLKEWRDRYFGQTPLMLTPISTKEVQEIVKIANEYNLKIVTQGGNTGLVGGQIPQGEILLSLEKMNKIRSINPLDDCIIAEAGVILETVQNEADKLNRRFPLSLASQGSATIGGLISTNAGGVHVRRYGMMRQLVLGLEAVLPNGEIYSELTALRKDNTGYDLKQFLIGAEGTLGIITAASLKLVAKPKESVVAMLGFEKCEDAIKMLHELENETLAVSAFEIMNQQAFEFGLKNIMGAKNPLEDVNPFTCLVEFEGIDQDFNEKIEKILWAMFDKEMMLDATLSQNEAQAKSFWALREGMSAAQKPEGRAAKHDVSVPISKIPVFLEEAEKAAQKVLAGVRIAAFGHISDGNIHYDAARPLNMSDDDFQAYIKDINHAVHDVVISLGGSISAEHGVGIARRDEFISREPQAHLNLMRAIKKTFDPNNILNPRVLL